MQGGFAYLCAVIDWHSRCVLAWELSNTLDTAFCVRTVQRALQTHGKPEIFNTDQGAQFTSHEFTRQLLDHGIKISMDGKGRALDNIFIERFWRTIKYEEIYLKTYLSLVDANVQIDAYVRFYNQHRPHSSHQGATPAEVYRMPPSQAAA